MGQLRRITALIVCLAMFGLATASAAHAVAPAPAEPGLSSDDHPASDPKEPGRCQMLKCPSIAAAEPATGDGIRDWNRRRYTLQPDEAPASRPSAEDPPPPRTRG